MTLVNHAAAGAVIALTIKQPYLVIPLALISHFVMDLIPHFGYPGHQGYKKILRHRLTYFYLFLDLVGWIFLVWAMLGLSWLAYVAAFMAVLPDIGRDLWRALFYYGLEKKGKPFRRGPLTKFHRWIQWCERPWGFIVEVIIGAGLISLVWELK